MSDIISGKVIALALELHSHPPLALNVSVQGLSSLVQASAFWFVKGQLVTTLGFVAAMASVTTLPHCSGKAAIDNM